MNDVAIGLASITKRFGRLTALDSASLTAQHGTVHALLGENGAGKTTLMRIAFGMLRPDSGTITVNGIQRRFESPGDAIAAGIGMVHQHFTLVPAMTVVENIALGGRGRFQPGRARLAVAELMTRTGLAVDPDARIEDLPAGAQQRVEILKALFRDTRILILDEPTAVLTPTEATDLLHKARELVTSGGTAILITHRIRDALEYADDITVLRHGSTVWSGPAAGATEDELVSAMLGGDLARTGGYSPASTVAATGPAVLSLRDVTARDNRDVARLKGVTLSVHGGEIVGIAGVEGNGQHELLRVLAGRIQATAGDVVIPEIVGFIPEDRHRDALIQDLTIRDNVALSGAGTRSGLMNWIAIGRNARELLVDYDVRAQNEFVRAGTLSGGNQQKLVVGREIDGSQTALVAENPSRGLDVQATAAVFARIRAARDAGMAVVIYSSDLDAVLELSDRVVVMYAGRIVEPARDYESIGRAMLGLHVE